MLVLRELSREHAQVFTFMILLATSANLVVYLVCSPGSPRAACGGARSAARGGARRGSRSRGLLGAVYSLWAIAGAGKEATLWGAALLVAALPVYALVKRSGPARGVGEGGE